MPPPISLHPLGLALAGLWTLFVLAIETYAWLDIGPHHLMWFSHLGLSATAVAMWWPQRLLVSCLGLAVLLPETVWILDFGLGVLLGDSPTGATAYMFGDWYPLDHQLLSLFHLPLPAVAWWQLRRVGYDPRALWLQSLVCGVVLGASWLLADERWNVNWVYSFGGIGGGLPSPWQLLLVLLGLILVVYLPCHLLFKRLFGP